MPPWDPRWWISRLPWQKSMSLYILCICLTYALWASPCWASRFLWPKSTPLYILCIPIRYAPCAPQRWVKSTLLAKIDSRYIYYGYLSGTPSPSLTGFTLTMIRAGAGMGLRWEAGSYVSSPPVRNINLTKLHITNLALSWNYSKWHGKT